jgi:hypothetical protein
MHAQRKVYSTAIESEGKERHMHGICFNYGFTPKFITSEWDGIFYSFMYDGISVQHAVI